ncbi:uncharacterized protein LTR77_010669 [Saxophila tyrrhenica]|uniref:T6SS Phospholipase effector Tle1-like catalytic domain-containing protein n=1 Tax=Saxophila tyrrhenica TaxID=1690608 RepID=A0AAV9NUT4_9PEZI|nr:hypothetical protein LTR77_010669 [Saxophila tyrrhenica]
MPSRDFAPPTPHNRHSSASDFNNFTRPKKLIVCCDGTWMDSDNGYVKGSWGQPGRMQTPSNVTRIARAISAEDDSKHAQIVYYQSGIGTGIGLTNHVLGGGTGIGLEENIREAYSFLASNYREKDHDMPGVPPDSIFLVGFSRGAYTARSIGGLLGAIGLLKKPAMSHFYEIFSDWMHAGDSSYTPLFFDSYFRTHKDVKACGPAVELARDKHRIDDYLDEYLKVLLAMDLTQEVQIRCIGVWDTVGALGVPVNPLVQQLVPFLPGFLRGYRWFDTRLDKHIDNAFQALALDERRFPFTPTLWEKRSGSRTNLKQVWFPGSHSNVGGSYSDTGIADITLAWMMDQLSGNTSKHPHGYVARDWIKFDDDYLWTSVGSEDPDTSPAHGPYRGWSKGKVYDTVYFPMSLTGTTVRAPARYHGTFWETGKPDGKRLLESTQEHVHSSVRARIDLGGRGIEPDWNQVFPNGLGITPWLVLAWRKLTGRPPKPYQPQRKGGPLHGWRLEDGHVSHREPNWDIDMSPVESRKISWVYEGEDQSCTRTMLEDKLGPYELKLLQRDQKFAEQIMVSNDEWRWTVKETGRPPKRGHTF